MAHDAECATQGPSFLKLLKLLPPPTLLEPQLCAIAEHLLRRTLFLIADKAFQLVEVEFYLHGKGHPDPYTHKAPEQARSLTWYFHRSVPGLDLAIGDQPLASHGGILIRSVRDIHTGELIEGTLNVVGLACRLNGCASKEELLALLASTQNREDGQGNRSPPATCDTMRHTLPASSRSDDLPSEKSELERSEPDPETDQANATTSPSKRPKHTPPAITSRRRSLRQAGAGKPKPPCRLVLVHDHDSLADSEGPIVRCPRVSLGVKKGGDDRKYTFLMAHYRFLTDTFGIKSGKPGIFLGLRALGMAQDRITEVTGCKAMTVAKYIGLLEDDLDVRRLTDFPPCRSLRLADYFALYRLVHSRKLVSSSKNESD